MARSMKVDLPHLNELEGRDRTTLEEALICGAIVILKASELAKIATELAEKGAEPSATLELITSMAHSLAERNLTGGGEQKAWKGW